MMSFPDGEPFVLLDDMADPGRSRLYTRPRDIISARRVDDVQPALDRLRQEVADGRHASGWLAYEAGYAFEPRLAPLVVGCGDDGPPLLWFGLFDHAEPITDVAALLPDPSGARALAPRLGIERAAYDAAVAAILGRIAAGEIYQANLTFQAMVAFVGDPLALYAGLRRASGASWGGIVYTGRHWLLSCSPEMMVALDGGILTARPMKGTAPRQPDPVADRAAVDALPADAKQRAENLMIVDLIRNDLARVARQGSVAVPALFAVETYPTVHQMTSTVTAALAPGRDAVDVVRAVFPCGSVTGAPKLRAMQVLHGIEQGPRGAYTGSIGTLAPDGSMALNVAIRTLVMVDGADVATLGLGSAIVADSVAAEEWAECRVKASFVTAGARPIDLIETMRFDPIEGVPELDRHMARLSGSAKRLGFRFDHHDARNTLHTATFRMRDAGMIRMRLSPSGALAVMLMPLPATPEGHVGVAVGPLPVDARDYRLAHKTSDRAFYDEARAESGRFEILFVDTAGFLTEGSFTNLFVERDGVLLTPPLSRGLLPGVLRAALLDSGRAIERDLVPDDLAGNFLIGNAVRGLMPARRD